MSSEIEEVSEISIQTFLEMSEKCKDLYIYEYYDGLQIMVDNVDYLLPTEDFTEFSNLIFSKISTLDNLITFGYTSRFSSELYYKELNINKNLQNLRIDHLIGIKPNHLGNIKSLDIRGSGGFKSDYLHLLPITLQEIYIGSLEVENIDVYNQIIDYFNSHDIKYHIDDFCDWFPSNNTNTLDLNTACYMRHYE